MGSEIEYHLRVYQDRFELHSPTQDVEVFEEGTNSPAAAKRSRQIIEELERGYLTKLIQRCRNEPELIDGITLSSGQISILSRIADQVTSEVGRAILGLSILQLTIKAIAPDQSIRLHKSGATARDFGWSDGISMRSIDKKYITPALRSEGLSRMNADGVMMTRSLAENYPYSLVYKAALRGARSEWLQMVDALESRELHAYSGLVFVLSRLLNHAADFNKLAVQTLELLAALQIEQRFTRSEEVLSFMQLHRERTDYAARLMEISMHSLMQAIEDQHGLHGLELVPLSQMRSANKKHGNVGDVELTDGQDIVVAWDAKYGKSYLRDELEELADKLTYHPKVREAGFVCSGPPTENLEVEARRLEMAAEFSLDLVITSFHDWMLARFEAAARAGIADDALASSWIKAYVETLAQARSTRAPIDEPCQAWLQEVRDLLLDAKG